MKRAAILMLVLTLCLGITGVADAKGKKSQDGLKGKIVGVSPNKVLIQQKGDKNGGTPRQIAIKVDANTTVEIDGVSGEKITDLQAGERVIVQGGIDSPATDIQATSHKGKGHKKA